MLKLVDVQRHAEQPNAATAPQVVNLLAVSRLSRSLAAHRYVLTNEHAQQSNRLAAIPAVHHKLAVHQKAELAAVVHHGAKLHGVKLVVTEILAATQTAVTLHKIAVTMATHAATVEIHVAAKHNAAKLQSAKHHDAKLVVTRILAATQTAVMLDRTAAQKLQLAVLLKETHAATMETLAATTTAATSIHVNWLS